MMWLKCFTFPTKLWKKQWQTKKCLPYHVLTDIDSTELMFVFIFDLDSTTPGHEFSNKTFEVMWSDLKEHIR